MDIRTKAQIVWLLYGLSIITVLSPFIGIVLAYLWRASSDGDPLAGHFPAQIRLFWRAAVGWAIGIGLIGLALYFDISAGDDTPTDDRPMAFNLGVLVILLTQIYFVIASLMGLYKAIKRYPIF